MQIPVPDDLGVNLKKLDKWSKETADELNKFFNNTQNRESLINWLNSK